MNQCQMYLITVRKECWWYMNNVRCIVTVRKEC